jgi:formate hydrogenlyase subunit 3/multisubunit Na+/H+ antiporter MnhD subunit
MGLLRLVPLILFFIFYKLAGTERAKYRLWAKQPFTFGTNVANHTIIMLLGLAFCCLAPLIAPFALLYFTLALVSVGEAGGGGCHGHAGGSGLLRFAFNCTSFSTSHYCRVRQ